MFYNVEFSFIIFGMMFTLSSALVDGTCDPHTNPCDANANEVCTNSKCVCKPGFNGATGQACSDIDECASNPCKNSGVCTNKVNAFACTCAAGWTGTTCETDIDECAANPCKNGGSCANGANKYTCTCAAGWAGTTCETAFDCSTGGTCQNGGTCGVAQAATCSCVTGWTGNDCGRDIDECKQNPCQHGGTCADQVNAYTCKCVAGWKGKNCETATLGIDCSGNKQCEAANNEVCGADDNKCACKPGFQVDSGTCKDIDECLSNPCLNGATCVNTVGSYTCTCVAGWLGATCNTFDCTGVTNACKNDGTCEAGKTACTCVAGYTGDDCGTAPDNSAGKTAVAAVTLMMAVLTNIIIQMF